MTSLDRGLEDIQDRIVDLEQAIRALKAMAGRGSRLPSGVSLDKLEQALEQYRRAEAARLAAGQ